MRRLIALAAFVVASACGGDSSTGPAPTGTLTFRIDAQSCTGSSTANFYLDGTLLGTQAVSPGSTHTFPKQPAGQHVVGASEARAGGFVWPSQAVTIPANGSYTHVLPCA